MDNLKDLIDRLNILESNRDNSNIHIDSMLKLTSEIYEALLHIKHQQAPIAINEENISISSFNEYINHQNTENSVDNDINNELEALFNSEYDKTVGASETTIEEISAKEIKNNTPVSASEHNNSSVDNEEHLISFSGINFEFPPATVYKKTEVNTPNQEESKHININNFEEEEIETAPTQKEQNNTIGQGFKAPVLPNQKDFRAQIGFNDRFLFMNELFKNNKELFDNTINKINNTNNIIDAKNWIQNEIVKTYHWDENDTTVQTFYGLLDKYFKTT